MGEVLQGINSRVSKTAIQSELIGSNLNNITRNSKNVINIEISEPPYPPYNDSVIDITQNPLVVDIYEPPLFIDNTIMYGDIPIVKIYYGDIPITKVYKGDTLIKDFNIE